MRGQTLYPRRGAMNNENRKTINRDVAERKAEVTRDPLRHLALLVLALHEDEHAESPEDCTAACREAAKTAA